MNYKREEVKVWDLLLPPGSFLSIQIHWPPQWWLPASITQKNKKKFLEVIDILSSLIVVMASQVCVMSKLKNMYTLEMYDYFVYQLELKDFFFKLEVLS